MYGIINKAIQDLVTENYGEKVWDEVLIKSNIEESYFLTTEIYDDEITYKLATAISEILKVDVKVVLGLLGEYWILKTSKERYSQLLESGGTSLKEFLVNIPFFHSRIALMYPKISAPDFKISNEEEDSICVHYFSHRPGLQEFVKGLFVGLSKYFDEKTEIDLIQSREDGFEHEIYKISWIK